MTTIAKAEVALRGKDETAQAFRNVVRNAEAASTQISAKFRGVFNFLGAGAAVYGLTRALGGAIKAGDELAKFAEKSGLGARAASELAHAAKMADLDLGQLATGVKFLQKNVSEAASGNKSAQETFHALGIEWTELKKLAPDQQLERVADQLAQIEDPADRARLATELFGRAGADLLPLFTQGAAGIRAAREEAVELGKSFSEEDLKRFSDAEDAMKRLSAAGGSLADTLAIKLSPSLIQLADSLRISLGGGNQVENLRQRIDDLEKIANAPHFGGNLPPPPWIAEAKAQLIELNKELARAEQGLGKGIRGGGGKGFGGTPPVAPPPGPMDPTVGKETEKARERIEQVIAATRQQIETYRQGAAATLAFRIAQGDLAKDLAKLGSAAGPVRATLQGLATDLQAAAEKVKTDQAREEIQALIDDIHEEIATFGMGEAAAAAYRAEHGRLGATFAATGDAAAAAREEYKRSTQALEDMQKAADELADKQQRANQIIEESRTPFERLRDEIQETHDLANSIDPKTGMHFIDAETESRHIHALIEEYKKATDEISEYWLEAQRGIQRSLAGFYRNLGKGSGRDLFQGILDSLRDAWANQLAAMTMDWFRMGDKLKQSSGGWFSKLFNPLAGGGAAAEKAGKTPAQQRASEIVAKIKESSGACKCIHDAMMGSSDSIVGAIHSGIDAEKSNSQDVIAGNAAAAAASAASINTTARGVGNFLASTMWAVPRAAAKEKLIGGALDALFKGFAGGFARGGTLEPGEWGVAGEGGSAPELVFGGRTGATIVPLSKSSRESGPSRPTFNISGHTYNVQIDSRSDRAAIQQDMVRFGRENNRDFMDFFRDQLQRGAFET